MKPKVYEALFRLLQATLQAKCHFSMPRRVVLRTPTLSDSTQTALRQTIQSHFSTAPMPLFLQDLCKSVVSTTKGAPTRVCDVVKRGPKPIALCIVKNALTSHVNKPFVKFDALSLEGREIDGKLLDFQAEGADRIPPSALTCIVRRRCLCHEWMCRYPCLNNDIHVCSSGSPDSGLRFLVTLLVR